MCCKLQVWLFHVALSVFLLLGRCAVSCRFGYFMQPCLSFFLLGRCAVSCRFGYFMLPLFVFLLLGR